MKKESKFLIISIPLIVILTAGAIYEYGIRGIQEEYNSINDLKTAKAETLKKYVETIQHKSDFEKQILTLKEIRKNENTKIMVAQTPAIAAANLQDSVKSIITGRGGTIFSNFL